VAIKDRPICRLSAQSAYNPSGIALAKHQTAIEWPDNSVATSVVIDDLGLLAWYREN